MSGQQQGIKNSTQSILFYASLLGILACSGSSYILSYIARGLSDMNTSDMGYFIIIQYSAMGIFMLVAWKTSPKSNRILDYRLMLGVAVVARVLLFDVQPYTSNDVDRYLFDGRIVVEGLDPYRVSHDTPVLKALREQWQPPQEHAKYVTLYPPVALGIFSLAASAGIDHAVDVWKLILLAASLSTLWLMVRVLQYEAKLKNLALLALSPLLILETGVGLHLDALSALAVVAAIYCWQRNKTVTSGVVIGLGMLTKVLPIMLLLPLFFAQRHWQAALKLVASVGVVVIGIYSLTLFLGFHPVGSVGIFFEKWRFASPIFELFDPFLSGKQTFATLLFIASVSCSFAAYVCWRNRETLTANRFLLFGIMQLMVALPLLLSPVIFPWYLMPLLPLLALYPNKYLISWTLLMPLTYEVIGGFTCCQIWQPAPWPVWLISLLQFAAVLALLRYCYQYWTQLTNRTNH